jgi:hypothetical protein
MPFKTLALMYELKLLSKQSLAGYWMLFHDDPTIAQA